MPIHILIARCAHDYEPLHRSVCTPRRRKVALRLHANAINGQPAASTRFDHIMCMSTDAWAELDALGLTWFDSDTVSDPIYQEAS